MANIKEAIQHLFREQVVNGDVYPITHGFQQTSARLYESGNWGGSDVLCSEDLLRIAAEYIVEDEHSGTTSDEMGITTQKLADLLEDFILYLYSRE